MQKIFLWSDCRFYFNKLYTLYEMLVLQFEKSRHFHPFPPLMMQFDDMILHVLLCSLSVVAKITAQILNHHRSSPTQWQLHMIESRIVDNDHDRRMDRFFSCCFFLQPLGECMYRSSNGRVPCVVPPRTWRNSVPEFPSWVSSSHLPQPLTSHDTQLTHPLDATWFLNRNWSLKIPMK